MDAWVWWLVATVVLLVGEMLTLTLVLGMLAVGTIAGAVTAAVGGSGFTQLGVFAVVSLGMLLVVRPVARRHMRQTSGTPTGVAALIGGEAEVLSEVDGRDGRVKVSGETWSARSYDGESRFPVGTVVRVVEISGATALVA